MEESVIETITKISNLDNEKNYTIARIMDNNKCVELHYNNGKACIEYGIRDEEDNTWHNEIDEDIDWFNLDLTDEEVLKKLNEKFDEHFPKEEKFEVRFYSEDEIKELIKANAELYYVDDGVDEAIINFEDIPDFIIDYNRNLEIRDLKFFKVGKDVYEPDITTYGEFLNTIKEDLRERMIDRLIALQTNEASIKKYKIIDEDLYSKVESKLEEEREQKKTKNKKNREVR